MNKRGFVQIPLLVITIASIVAGGGIGYGAVEYHKISKTIEEAEQLVREERYTEAIEKLKFAQDRWLTKNLGIRKQEITKAVEKNKTLLEDKSEYNQGIEEFSKENWERAKELLLKVSEIFPHYQDAKSKIEEVQKKITEKLVVKAIEKVKEEAQRKIEEEKARRITAEAQLRFERQITQKEITELRLERKDKKLGSNGTNSIKNKR